MQHAGVGPTPLTCSDTRLDPDCDTLKPAPYSLCPLSGTGVTMQNTEQAELLINAIRDKPPPTNYMFLNSTTKFGPRVGVLTLHQ